MFTIVAFADSLDPAGALVNFPAIVDDHVAVSANFLYVGAFNNIVGFYVIADGTTEAFAQLQSPSLRRVALIDISPVEVGTDIADHDAVQMFPANPLSLIENEGLEALINSDPGAAAQQAVVVFLSDGVLAPIGGEVFTVRATASITGAVETWVSEALVFDQILPVGRYALVGARVQSANLMAARFIPIGGTHRPGVPPVTSDEQYENPIFRRGGLGTWLEFDSRTPPLLEVLTGSTSTAQVVYLDLIKLA